MNLSNTHPRFFKWYRDADQPTRDAIQSFYEATDVTLGEYARLHATLTYAALTFGYDFTP